MVDFNTALSASLAQYEELLGRPFAPFPTIETVPDEALWARADQSARALNIAVSSGLIASVEALWQTSVSDPWLADANDDSLPFDADWFSHVSLVWLLMHEMQHADLDHFAFLGRKRIAEADQQPGMGLLSRAASSAAPVQKVRRQDRPLVEPCLELQADHDAIELVLDAYSPDDWPAIRYRTAAVSGMMVLIETAEQVSEGMPRSHPKAATRIFQLLGHVMEMPTIPAMMKAQLRGETTIDPEDLPSDEEQRAFATSVTLPCYRDAVHLARLAGASAIADDLGDERSFFNDLKIAKLMDVDQFPSLVTAGGQEWASLVALNDRLLRLQGLI
ncbi:hypothetical protein DXV76_03585 [Rhodobacteraceae bacterium CCMM004]|nr:hypothetical protein DXV76_03585 [Rhodobacteraceae bacterium CCMM004]